MKCKFCNEEVNLQDEVVIYRDESCAHEGCHDSNEFQKENAADFRD